MAFSGTKLGKTRKLELLICLGSPVIVEINESYNKF